MNAPTIRAPRGPELSCKGWPHEAALRMLMNNLDPEVAERPEDLVVYGGTGKAARSWPDYHRIVASLRSLEADETLVLAQLDAGDGIESLKIVLPGVGIELAQRYVPVRSRFGVAGLNICRRLAKNCADLGQHSRLVLDFARDYSNFH